MEDFGEFFWDIAEEWVRKQMGPEYSQQPPNGMSQTGSGPVIDPVTGAVAPHRHKRRRRRRLLTPTDLSDLAALKTIVGNTDALKFAVTKAVRR